MEYSHVLCYGAIFAYKSTGTVTYIRNKNDGLQKPQA